MVKAFVIVIVNNHKVKIYIKDIQKITVLTKGNNPNIPHTWNSKTNNHETMPDFSNSSCIDKKL